MGIPFLFLFEEKQNKLQLSLMEGFYDLFTHEVLSDEGGEI